MAERQTGEDQQMVVLEDLRRLVEAGVSPVTLGSCRGIASLFIEPDEFAQLRPGALAVSLRDLLEAVLAENRHDALLTLGGVTKTEESHSAANRVAGAGELLGITNTELERVKHVREKQLGESWEKLIEKPDNRGPVRLKRLRAAMWVGAASAATGMRQADRWLADLAAALMVYLADLRARDEYRKKMGLDGAASHINANGVESFNGSSVDLPLEAGGVKSATRLLKAKSALLAKHIGRKLKNRTVRRVGMFGCGAALCALLFVLFFDATVHSLWFEPFRGFSRWWEARRIQLTVAVAVLAFSAIARKRLARVFALGTCILLFILTGTIGLIGAREMIAYEDLKEKRQSWIPRNFTTYDDADGKTSSCPPLEVIFGNYETPYRDLRLCFIENKALVLGRRGAGLVHYPLPLKTGRSVFVEAWVQPRVGTDWSECGLVVGGIGEPSKENEIRIPLTVQYGDQDRGGGKVDVEFRFGLIPRTVDGAVEYFPAIWKDEGVRVSVVAESSVSVPGSPHESFAGLFRNGWVLISVHRTGKHFTYFVNGRSVVSADLPLTEIDGGPDYSVSVGPFRKNSSESSRADVSYCHFDDVVLQDASS